MFGKIKKIIGKVSWKKIGNVAYWLTIAILLVIAGLTVVSAAEIPNGFRLYIVQSGSMTPTISAGSIVLIKPESNYKEDDIITFKTEKERDNPRPQYTTTHRIAGIKTDKGTTFYVTKGDANSSPDGTLVDKDLILGKVIFQVPLIGYVVSYAKTIPGLIVLVVIPATIIVWGEIINIKNEFLKIIKGRKNGNKK